MLRNATKTLAELIIARLRDLHTALTVQTPLKDVKAMCNRSRVCVSSLSSLIPDAVEEYHVHAIARPSMNMRGMHYGVSRNSFRSEAAI